MVAKNTGELDVVAKPFLEAARESMGDKGSEYSDAELQAVATYFSSIFTAVVDGTPPYMPKHMLGLYFAHVFVENFMPEAILRGVINVKSTDDVVNDTLDKLKSGSVESARETMFGKGPLDMRSFGHDESVN